MSRPAAPPEPSFGFLSVLEIEEFGYLGGYLILNLLGRPLEFHCTAPVRPSRAQEILYGPTLQSYLLGEQIAGTLLAEARLQVEVVLADHAAMLCLRPEMRMPIVLVECGRWGVPPAASETCGDGDVASSDRCPTRRLPQQRVVAGGRDLRLPLGFEAEGPIVADRLTRLARHVDLAEPFDRIHEAIREAQRIGQRGGESHVPQAA